MTIFHFDNKFKIVTRIYIILSLEFYSIIDNRQHN